MRGMFATNVINRQNYEANFNFALQIGRLFLILENGKKLEPFYNAKEIIILLRKHLNFTSPFFHVIK